MAPDGIALYLASGRKLLLIYQTCTLLFVTSTCAGSSAPAELEFLGRIFIEPMKLIDIYISVKTTMTSSQLM